MSDCKNDESKGGRPTKHTPELEEKFCELIASGNTIKTACAYVGISTTTFDNWCKRGEDGEEPFLGFLGAYKKAIAKAEVWHVSNIAKHAKTHWQASAWWLERRCPEEFNLKHIQEHTHKHEGPITLDFQMPAPRDFTEPHTPREKEE